MAPDLVWHPPSVSRAQREARSGHRARLVWFTGFSGAGKSSLAHALEQTLFAQGRPSYVLDGDNVRHGLCSDLGFSPEDRRENLRRVAEVARLLLDAGITTLAAFISPLRADRALVQSIVGAEQFLEVFVDCPLAVCEARDVKGMYRKARSGALPQFTGISAPYEPPLAPQLQLRTDQLALADCVSRLCQCLGS